MRQDEVTSRIGHHVRTARTKSGLSRKRLAASADISERYLNQLEKGEANVSVGILVRVAAALGVDLANLLPHAHGDAHSSLLSASIHKPLAHLIGTMTLREQEGAVEHLQRYLADIGRARKGVALLGLRGAGKSTVGGLFAARHGLPFLSVTREIETRAGMSLDDLFNLGGADGYRTLENEVVRELVDRDQRMVLETAGGIVSNKDALDVILGSFRTVWLKASPEEHLERVTRQGDMRPMRGTTRAIEHLKSLLAQREQAYARADHVVDTTGKAPEVCVAELELIAGQPMHETPGQTANVLP